MRYCQTLDLKDVPELIEEYKYWHNPENIWKEIPEGIKNVGILDMEIYLFGNRLFMIIETPDNLDWEKQMNKLKELPRQQEWEKFMDIFQQPLEKAILSGKWQPMERIFSLKESFCENNSKE